jgi:putative ABC transport system permease protein
MEAQEVMLSVSSAKTTFLRELSILLGNLSLVISVILGFLIVYANNFLVKRRKKEI